MNRLITRQLAITVIKRVVRKYSAESGSPKVFKGEKMHITKVNIVNFKCFDGLFTLDLNPNLNILVGDNEAGKSSILEAINLALSGWINGRYLLTELSQSF